MCIILEEGNHSICDDSRTLLRDLVSHKGDFVKLVDRMCEDNKVYSNYTHLTHNVFWLTKL